jgi:hypothetical protein
MANPFERSQHDVNPEHFENGDTVIYDATTVGVPGGDPTVRLTSGKEYVVTGVTEKGVKIRDDEGIEIEVSPYFIKHKEK